MGVRERNAARTRESILDAALALFIERGYDATKMEDVAAAADVGTSTLYRYFPGKDDLLIEPLALSGHLSGELGRRPPEESLDIALGHALRALLLAPRANRDQQQKIMQIIESHPSPRKRLREEFVRERLLLEEAVADRLGRPRDDVHAIITARLATVVLELIVERSSTERGLGPEQDLVDAIEHVLTPLRREPPIAPAL